MEDNLKYSIKELYEDIILAYASGYQAGHEDTVEGVFSDPEETAEEWFNEGQEYNGLHAQASVNDSLVGSLLVMDANIATRNSLQN